MAIGKFAVMFWNFPVFLNRYLNYLLANYNIKERQQVSLNVIHLKPGIPPWKSISKTFSFFLQQQTVLFPLFPFAYSSVHVWRRLIKIP